MSITDNERAAVAAAKVDSPELSEQLAEAFDPRAFRNALGHYASGITIITSEVDGVPIGLTCQSFYSVSLEPPLVSFSVATSSTTYPLIRETGKFAVNVLSNSQTPVSTQFSRSGTDKWAGIDWVPSAGGNPLIHDTLMWLDCTIEEEVRAGDHEIVIGRVHSMSPAEWHTGEPLLFFKGKYRQLAEHSEAG